MLTKLLSLVAVGETISGISLTRKFVAGVAAIIGLTVIAAIIMGALTVLGLYEFHVLLTRHGTDPDLAVLYAALLGLGVIAALLLLIVNKVKRIRSLPLNISTLGSTGLSSLQALWRGFQKGFSDDRPA